MLSSHNFAVEISDIHFNAYTWEILRIMWLKILMRFFLWWVVNLFNGFKWFEATSAVFCLITNLSKVQFDKNSIKLSNLTYHALIQPFVQHNPIDINLFGRYCKM